MQSVLQLTIEIEQEEDGRWIAEILELPGVLAYGSTEAAAISLVKAIALVEIGERLQHGEPLPGGTDLGGISFRAA
jgi:predicted RNase H-like HicB family nuclease